MAQLVDRAEKAQQTSSADESQCCSRSKQQDNEAAGSVPTEAIMFYVQTVVANKHHLKEFTSLFRCTCGFSKWRGQLRDSQCKKTNVEGEGKLFCQVVVEWPEGEDETSRIQVENVRAPQTFVSPLQKVSNKQARLFVFVPPPPKKTPFAL